jgi:hypothetical protein
MAAPDHSTFESGGRLHLAMRFTENDNYHAGQSCAGKEPIVSGKKNGDPKRTIYRSSETGRIVKPEYAKTHPSTTEKERVRIPPAKKR